MPGICDSGGAQDRPVETVGLPGDRGDRGDKVSQLLLKEIVRNCELETFLQLKIDV